MTFVAFKTKLLFCNSSPSFFMSRPFALLVFFSLAFSAFAQGAPGDHKKAAALPTRTPAQVQQLRADRYATAQSLSAELTHHLALKPGAEAKLVAECVEHLLGIDTEKGFTETTADIHSLDLLLNRCTAPLQRSLAPVLSEPAYHQYVALLDARGVKAE
jgi:hypothetical protein